MTIYIVYIDYSIFINDSVINPNMTSITSAFKYSLSSFQSSIRSYQKFETNFTCTKDFPRLREKSDSTRSRLSTER